MNDMSILITIALLVVGTILDSNAETSECTAPDIITYDSGDKGQIGGHNRFYTRFVPIPQNPDINSFKVSIQAEGDAYITFLPKWEDTNTPDSALSIMYDVSPTIVLGGYKGYSAADSSGAYCEYLEHWTKYNTPNILSANEEREFEIQWQHWKFEGVMAHMSGFQVWVYKMNGDGTKSPLFTHLFDCVPRSVDYIGYFSDLGVDATWQFCFDNPEKRQEDKLSELDLLSRLLDME